MLDDYKDSQVSEEWELSTYFTFDEAHSERAYEEVEKFREGEGSTSEMYNQNTTKFDKLYELKNLSRFYYYNGVRYFYFIQGKFDQIAEIETTYIINSNADLLYDFIYTTNPVDLVFLCAGTKNNRNCESPMYTN
jgi:hypothetical protein